MTIDEHIRRQGAGKLSRDYPVEIITTAREGEGYVCAVNIEQDLSQPTALSMSEVDRVERNVVTRYRKAINAINTYRKQRGEQEL